MNPKEAAIGKKSNVAEIGQSNGNRREKYGLGQREIKQYDTLYDGILYISSKKHVLPTSDAKEQKEFTTRTELQNPVTSSKDNYFRCIDNYAGACSRPSETKNSINTQLLRAPTNGYSIIPDNPVSAYKNRNIRSCLDLEVPVNAIDIECSNKRNLLKNTVPDIQIPSLDIVEDKLSSTQLKIKRLRRKDLFENTITVMSDVGQHNLPRTSFSNKNGFNYFESKKLEMIPSKLLIPQLSKKLNSLSIS